MLIGFLDIPVGSLRRFRNESDKTVGYLISLAPAGPGMRFLEVGTPLDCEVITAPPQREREINGRLEAAWIRC